MVSLKEGFRFYDGFVLPPNFGGETYYHIWSDGAKWFVLNPRNEEEVGPFDSGPAAIKEAQSLAQAEGLTLVKSWPWDQEDVGDYKV